MVGDLRAAQDRARASPRLGVQIRPNTAPATNGDGFAGGALSYPVAKQRMVSTRSGQTGDLRSTQSAGRDSPDARTTGPRRQ
ncbi:hypothetical protein ACCO45_000840 [Purpureocillium lilacinum]|uniref:Uncharacterized protein n=1 Tax=Purpureocillium lilacinum TaxID=33203 RepID=A0ACC4E868_PURLI